MTIDENKLMMLLNDWWYSSFGYDEGTEDSKVIKTVMDEIEKNLKDLILESCEDAISRADAVKVASGYCHPANIAKELAKLPPVTPIRPKGHWLSVHTGKPSHLKDGMAVESIKCSECGEWLTASDEYACNGNYCPNCGADMREVEG